jgi:hypothetical protein
LSDFKGLGAIDEGAVQSGRRAAAQEVPRQAVQQQARPQEPVEHPGAAGAHLGLRAPGHSVIKVRGRELGVQHRDAIYGVFRVGKNPKKLVERAPDKHPMQRRVYFVVNTSWRELLRAMAKTEHMNNLLTLHEIFEEIKQVVFTVYEGSQRELYDAVKHRRWDQLREITPAGGIRSLFDSIEWTGLDLDSEVTITFGEWTVSMIAQTKLVSLNADVQFELKSGHAKSFWPYIDSMSNHFYVDEDMLAALVGRDIWSDAETKVTRGQFRKDCKQAFDDMVRAGGLKAYRVETTGEGRRKSRRYFYEHRLCKQMELEL